MRNRVRDAPPARRGRRTRPERGDGADRRGPAAARARGAGRRGPPAVRRRRLRPRVHRQLLRPPARRRARALPRRGAPRRARARRPRRGAAGRRRARGMAGTQAQRRVAPPRLQALLHARRPRGRARRRPRPARGRLVRHGGVRAMSWTTTTDPHAFLDAAGGFLHATPAQSSVILTRVETMRAQPARDGLLGFWPPPGEAVGGAFMHTPPYPAAVTAMPDAAAAALAADLAGAAHALPGVNGNPDACEAFAATWAERTGATVTVHRRMRLHRLDALVPPDPMPAGEPGLAGPAHPRPGGGGGSRSSPAPSTATSSSPGTRRSPPRSTSRPETSGRRSTTAWPPAASRSGSIAARPSRF